MNERINRLSEQARDYANEVYLAPVRSKTPGKIWEEGHITWENIFQEKFADLIIIDCASLVNNWGRWLLFDKLAVKIKQHFGVKE
jgi:hypothetical protein